MTDENKNKLESWQKISGEVTRYWGNAWEELEEMEEMRILENIG